MTDVRCHLCGAARITTGQNVCDGSSPYECGSVIRVGLVPDVRVVGDQCARWATDYKRAVSVMDANYRQLKAQRDALAADVARMFDALEWIASRPGNATAADERATLIDRARRAIDDYRQGET